MPQPRRVRQRVPAADPALDGVNVRDEQARMFAVSDSHSPPRWRVTGALSHQPAFAAAFGCKTGDAMLREEESQAEVW
ncbi:MAG TPA: M13-type metalloendopeptidase [Casimicrobiaceae bacterium]